MHWKRILFVFLLLHVPTTAKSRSCLISPSHLTSLRLLTSTERLGSQTSSDSSPDVPRNDLYLHPREHLVASGEGSGCESDRATLGDDWREMSSQLRRRLTASKEGKEKETTGQKRAELTLLVLDSSTASDSHSSYPRSFFA
jgi:hypothetical protein